MNTALVNLKETAIPFTQSLVKVLIILKHRLLTLLVNGVAFLCISILFITAIILFNNHHLHISVTVDNQKPMIIDLRKNH
jgi:hypothetical protein